MLLDLRSLCSWNLKACSLAWVPERNTNRLVQQSGYSNTASWNPTQKFQAQHFTVSQWPAPTHSLLYLEPSGASKMQLVQFPSTTWHCAYLATSGFGWLQHLSPGNNKDQAAVRKCPLWQPGPRLTEEHWWRPFLGPEQGQKGLPAG